MADNYVQIPAGLPLGGTTGQVLSKVSNANYDVTWSAGGGGGITALTGDVTASGTGSVAATVAFVGGASAASVASTVSTVAAAASAATPSTLMLRDSSGDVSVSALNCNGGALINHDLTLNSGRFISTQFTVPTTTVDANAGVGATFDATNATDVAGHITLVTGTGAGAGLQGSVVYPAPLPTVAPIVVLTPTNANAAANAVQAYVTSTTSGFSLNFVVGGADATTYSYNYIAIVTQ